MVYSKCGTSFMVLYSTNNPLSFHVFLWRGCVIFIKSPKNTKYKPCEQVPNSNNLSELSNILFAIRVRGGGGRIPPDFPPYLNILLYLHRKEDSSETLVRDLVGVGFPAVNCFTVIQLYLYRNSSGIPE